MMPTVTDIQGEALDGRNLPDSLVLSTALRHYCQEEHIGDWSVDGRLLSEVHLSLPRLAIGLGWLADKEESKSPFSQLWKSRGTNNKLHKFVKRYLPPQAMTLHVESLTITLKAGFPFVAVSSYKDHQEQYQNLV